jgi:hypothetical protein
LITAGALLWSAVGGVLHTAAVTPVDSATGSLVSYVLNFGILGIVAVAFAFRFIVPRSAVVDAEARARADLIKEQERILAEKSRAEEQRDEALRIANTQLVPLLISFNGTVSALLPVLQEVVRRHDDVNRRSR